MSDSIVETQNDQTMTEIDKNAILIETINNIMAKTVVESSEIQRVSMKETYRSFILSAVICVVGLILLGVIVVFAALELISFDIALVTGVASAIAELGSGISLVLHHRASTQITRYFEALHETEWVMHSMSMMLQIRDDKVRDDALSEAAVNLAGRVNGTCKPED